MQYIGLLGLLITIALAGWWFSSNVSTDEIDSNEDTKTYQDVIDSARDTVKKAEDSILISSKLVFVYDGISVPDDTRVLDLSNENLSGSLKAEIRLLSSLKELNISNNNFTGLPAEVGQLSQLEILNLSNNPLTGLPQELGKLKKLKVLDLRGTEYSSFDMDIIQANLPSSTQVLVD